MNPRIHFRLAIVAFAMAVAPHAAAEGYDLGNLKLSLIDDPVQIDLQQRIEPARLRDLIAAGAGAKQWKVSKESPGRLELENIVRGKHMARVEVAYTDLGYRVSYIESTNLLYQERQRGGVGVRAVHRTYNSLLTNLTGAINIAIAQPVQRRVGFARLEDVDALPGAGEEARNAYRQFLRASLPRAFAVGAQGEYGWSEQRVLQRSPNRTVREEFREQQDPVEIAVEQCKRKGGGRSCRLYAIDDRVVLAGPPK